MKTYLKQLAAVEEMRLEQEASRGFAYLNIVSAECSSPDREGLWAAANNAALIAFSLHRGNKRIFSGAEEVLQEMGFDQIADMALSYQEKFEQEDWQDE